MLLLGSMALLKHGKAGGNTLGRPLRRSFRTRQDRHCLQLPTIVQRREDHTWEAGSIQPLPIIIPWTSITSPLFASVSKQQASACIKIERVGLETDVDVDVDVDDSRRQEKRSRRQDKTARAFKSRQDTVARVV